MLTFTKSLLSIESTSDKPKNLLKVIDLTENFLKSKNIFIKRFFINKKPSLVATMSKTKTPHIYLNGHLDVVPGKTEQFKPKIVGDKLYARGAQDMKSSAFILMKVFKDLANDKSFPRDKLGLMLNTDEEIGGHNGVKALIKKGYKTDFVLTGEPTDFNIEIATKGVLWLELSCKGKAAHGAYPWNGKNAITPITKSIEALQKLYPTPKKAVWKTTCNISSIQGGHATNRVPDNCLLKLDIRYVPQDKPENIIERIKKKIPSNVELQVLMQESTLQTNKNHPYLKILSKITKKHLKKTPKYIKQHGASDARFFSKVGIPTTSFGPAGARLHSDNEWVSLKSLEQYESILKDFLIRC